MTIKSYKDLIVWQKSYNLTLSIFKISAVFPGSEKFNLTSQLRRAALSVPLNIAEGNSRIHVKEYVHFLIIARGSLSETETCLLLAKDIHLISEELYDQINRRSIEVSIMLNALIRSLRGKAKRERGI